MPFSTPDFYTKPLFVIVILWIVIGYVKWKREKDILKVFAYLLSKEILLISAAILLVFVIGQFLLNLLSRL